MLSIDIDGNDFYVWKALDDKYRPKLVVIEFNVNYPPENDMVIPYNPNFRWDGTNYFGANITALCKLSKEKQYTLIYAESTGCNLFFVPDELAEQYFTIQEDIRWFYFNASQKGGHQPDPHKRPYISSWQALEYLKKR